MAVVAVNCYDNVFGHRFNYLRNCNDNDLRLIQEKFGPGNLD